MGQLLNSGWRPTNRTPSLRLLVVGANQRWTRVVTAEAARLGAAVVDTAGDSHLALARILTAPEPYSLILLQTRRSDPSAGGLADLALGGAGSNTGLLLLGDTGRHPAGSTVVEHPTRAAISKALRQYSWSPAETVPVLTKAQLVAALDGPMLKLRYQPIVRLSDREPLGVETLARLEHPELGMLSADQFIPQIEAAGLSQLFTRRMITQSMQEMSRIGLTQLGLAVGLNVPLNVLLMPDIFELLDTQRQKCAVLPDKIVIELTETQPVKDLGTLHDVVRRLRGIGYRVAIDDATPAMANLAEMIEIGFTTLKFDKSIVQQARHDSDCHDFIQRITRLATAAGVSTVAEGIEDWACVDLMQTMGLTSAQGYLIAHPLPAPAVKPWLETWRPGGSPSTANRQTGSLPSAILNQC